MEKGKKISEIGIVTNFGSLPIIEPRIPDFSKIAMPSLPRDHKMADTFYDRLKIHIKGIEKELKKDEQLLLYCGDKTGNIIYVTDIGYHNPPLIIFYGFDSEKNECHVMIHMNSVQLNAKIIKINKGKERRKIGFHQYG